MAFMTRLSIFAEKESVDLANESQAVLARAEGTVSSPTRRREQRVPIPAQI